MKFYVSSTYVHTCNLQYTVRTCGPSFLIQGILLSGPRSETPEPWEFERKEPVERQTPFLLWKVGSFPLVTGINNLPPYLR